MTSKTKTTIRALAKHAGLRIKYVGDLPGKVSGFLDPSRASRTIVINASKSKSDHAFTILHEIAHYLMHFRRSHRPRLPWYLQRQWKSNRVNGFFKKVKRYGFRVLNNECEADLWAFAALIQIGAKDDLQVIIAAYPEKAEFFFLTAATAAFTAIKIRLKRALQSLISIFGSCLAITCC